jgi:PleD family two-component response regulator
MADSFRTTPLIPVAPAKGAAREAESQAHFPFPPPHHLPYPPSAPPPTEHTATDVASILGLPEGVVTPAVLAAVTGLLGELDRLRWQDEHFRHRLAHLETLADRHPLVPALNRRGFMRVVEALLNSGNAEGTLAVLHVAGIESIRQHDGLAAGDAAIRHVCANLVGALRATDPLGLLGGGAFGLVLVSTGLAAARSKVREMMERINLLPFVWQGEAHSFAMASGYHLLKSGETAEAAVASADLARRGIAS